MNICSLASNLKAAAFARRARGVKTHSEKSQATPSEALAPKDLSALASSFSMSNTLDSRVICKQVVHSFVQVGQLQDAALVPNRSVGFNQFADA